MLNVYYFSSVTLTHDDNNRKVFVVLDTPMTLNTTSRTSRPKLFSQGLE